MLAKLDPEDREVVDGALDQAEKTEAELRYLADHDSLTGLLDRRRFRAELDQYVSFTARYGGQGAVMIIDIDGLKAINDALGHHAGDNLIRHVAAIMRERVRATDIVARLSGDEFAVLMPQADTAGALQLGEDLRAQVAEDAAAGARDRAGDDQRRHHDVRRRARSRRRGGPGRRRPGDVPGEGGGAQPDRPLPGPERAAAPAAAPPDDQRADPRRAHPGPAQPAHPADPQPRLRRDRALRAAAADDRRERRAAAGRLLHRGRRALRHGPGARPLGRRPGARSCSPSASGTGSPVSLHVNLSGASVADLSVLEFIERQLDEGEADPARCTFEITETAPVHDYEAAAGFADRLTEFGCQVAIDDYGAGFGPFHYLKSIPFDLIKIDGSFIRDMPRSDADQLTVQAIVQIARGLGKTTIAEYVQDDVTAQMLREYGVDMAQGYHLGRPVDVAEALASRPYRGWRAARRLILPLLVFGSSAANSTMRGNL